jgi:hypothetical protein
MRQIIFIFLCFWLSACRQKQNQGETIVVDNGIEIPIKACVEANTTILGNSVDHVAFCKCLIPKLYADLKNDPEKLKLLKEGNWLELSKDKQELVTKYYQNCITESATKDSTAKFTLTPRMVAGIKKKMKQELIGSEIEQTNDVDKYCDCLLNSFQTDFTVNEIVQDNFNETEKCKKVADKCLNTTKKN